jgi:hypothetical protein
MQKNQLLLEDVDKHATRGARSREPQRTARSPLVVAAT